jgi:hypothetical protein
MAVKAADYAGFEQRPHLAPIEELQRVVEQLFPLRDRLFAPSITFARAATAMSRSPTSRVRSRKEASKRSPSFDLGLRSRRE